MKQNFLQRFSNFIFFKKGKRKKKREMEKIKKKRKKEGRDLLIIKLLSMSPTTHIFYTFLFLIEKLVI